METIILTLLAVCTTSIFSLVMFGAMKDWLETFDRGKKGTHKLLERCFMFSGGSAAISFTALVVALFVGAVVI